MCRLGPHMMKKNENKMSQNYVNLLRAGYNPQSRSCRRYSLSYHTRPVCIWLWPIHEGYFHSWRQQAYFQLNFTVLKQGGLVLDCIDIRAWDNGLMQTPSSKSSFNSTYQCQSKQIRPCAAMCHINNNNDGSVIIKEFIKTLLRWSI